MGVAVKRFKIAQSVHSGLAMLGPYGFELDGDLNDDRRGHCDRDIMGRLRRAGARAQRNINHPIRMADLLMVAQLGN